MDMKKCDICGKIYPESELRYEMMICEVKKRDAESKKSRRQKRIEIDVCAECRKTVLERIGIGEEKENELTVQHDFSIEF